MQGFLMLKAIFYDKVRRLIYEIIRRMIGTVVTDLIETTQSNIADAKPRSIEDVRKAGRPLVALSADVHEQHLALKRFLARHLYSHERKLEMTKRAARKRGEKSMGLRLAQEIVDAADNKGTAVKKRLSVVVGALL